MYSRMNILRTMAIIHAVIYFAACVPPAYRIASHSPRVTQQTYQNFHYEEDMLIQYDSIENYEDTALHDPPASFTPSGKSAVRTHPIVQEHGKSKNQSPSQKGRWHTIKKGETLFRLSKQYNVSIDVLRTANNISSPAHIKAGQRIFIPLPNSADGNNTPSRSNRTASTEKSASRPSFVWPVRSVISFSHDEPNKSRPLGIVIKSTPNSTVTASAGGRVVKIGSMRGFGNFIVIQHQQEYYTIYSKLDSITVSNGQSVNRGAMVGLLNGSNPLLHFQINHSGKPLDPLNYLSKR